MRVEFVKESLVFTGEDAPMANLVLYVMGAFFEFERSLIRERRREGIALAKQRGAYKGRKGSDVGTGSRAGPVAGSGIPKVVLARDSESAGRLPTSTLAKPSPRETSPRRAAPLAVAYKPSIIDVWEIRSRTAATNPGKKAYAKPQASARWQHRRGGLPERS